ncbi:MAG: general secretion pathway protein K [Bermanella sp.]|jgi:general secretion pathway protein K
MRLNRQSGVALITVLLIFALVSMLAVSIQTQQEQSFRQASSTLENTNTFITLLSIEDIAKAGLMYDNKRDKDENELWDTASELWNQPFPLTLENSQVAIYIRDLQGLFNVNSLHPQHPQNSQAKARFTRLLSGLGIDTSVAQNLTEWFTESSSFNYEYESLTPGYTSPEIEFSHVSELMLVQGMNTADFKLLEPFISALPMATPLNINTSNPEVLSAWDAGLTLAQSRDIINKTRSNACGPGERNNFVFKEVNDLFEEPSIKALITANTNNGQTGQTASSAWDNGDFDVKTKYFSVISVLKTETQEIALESIIKRDPDTDFIGTIYRDFSRKPSDVNRLVKTMNCAGAQ